MPTVHPLNAFWLLVPLLAFNLVFASRLPPRYSDDKPVPRWLARLEQGLRVPAFVGPLFLPLGMDSLTERCGLGLYVVGGVLYLASWIPLLRRPEGPWSTSWFGGLAPAWTPVLWFAGIAAVGESALYGAGAAAFLVAHNAVTWFKLKRAASGRRSEPSPR